MGDSYKVLVVDDSPFIFKAVKKALEPNGFEMVGHAENGKIGLEMYDQFKPDIITLDVTMPVMDGLETAKNLYSKNPKIKIIMLSAMGDEDLMKQARAFGVKNFISKPFKAEELLSLVRSMLDIKV
jgi:two-component system, chemotaxis family, chemotaxis protein CheY